MGCVLALARHYKHNPEQLSNEAVCSFLQSLVEKGASASSIKVHLNALVCYYRDHLGRNTESVFSVLPKKSRKQRRSLPKFYSRSEILRLLESVTALDERLFLMLAYSCGLRLSECIHLRWRDIHFARNTVFVDCGKGGKDRYVPLSRTLKSYLKMHFPAAYAGEVAAGDYIFASGRKGRDGEAISTATGQQ